MVLRPPDHDIIELWEVVDESTVKDIKDGKIKRGVTRVSLREKIKKHKKDPRVEIAVHHLLVERTPKMIGDLDDFIAECEDKPYIGMTKFEDQLEAIKALYDGPLKENPEEDLSSIFCSELVAATYQRMGLLPLPLKSPLSN